MIVMSSYSDTNWEPVELLKQDFIRMLSKPNSKDEIRLIVETKFIRKVIVF